MPHVKAYQPLGRLLGRLQLGDKKKGQNIAYITVAIPMETETRQSIPNGVAMAILVRPWLGAPLEKYQGPSS